MDVAEVNKLIKQHAQMAKMMKKFSNPAGMSKMMRSLGNLQNSLVAVVAQARFWRKRPAEKALIVFKTERTKRSFYFRLRIYIF